MSKLYTEEQVRKAYSAGAIDCEYKCTKVTLKGFEPIVNMEHLKVLMDGFVKTLTPIELPTDEEVDEYINSFPYTKHLDDGQYNDGVIVGAELAIEWMRDKIKGGDNE